LFALGRPIAHADYATRNPRPRQAPWGALAIRGSAGEFGSIAGRATDFLIRPLPPLKRKRGTVGNCGDAVVSSAGHQKYLVKCSIQSKSGCDLLHLIFATQADGSPSATRESPCDSM